MAIKNQIKTVILLGLLTALLLWVGHLVGGARGLTIGLAFAIIMNFGSYWFSDKIVLAIYKAKKANKKEYPELHKIIEELSKQAKIPKPEIYIIPTQTANAFATGRSPKHAAIAVTQGILKILDKDELKGVLGHEMSHIVNRDTLITTIAATIAGVISYVAFMARWAAIFGGGRDREGAGNIISLLVLAIITPLIATMLQLALSRSREFMADAKGARLSKQPLALARALQKLDLAAKIAPMRKGNAATSSLFIVNPFTAKGIAALFSTHPSTAERVERLKRMKI
ncbi:MAG TPA: protease HtpX [Candidatus Woesearchaeota archaeon]|nr:MAG: protease HtpX [Candidatus Woesearchaeota archaeon]HDD70867.1 protease HtpX [Candidatus Woesearchaeota archaeon]